MFHVVNFGSGHLVRVLYGTLALFLVDDGLGKTLLNRGVFRCLGLVCVAFISVLFASCDVVKQTYRLLACQCEDSKLHHNEWPGPPFVQQSSFKSVTFLATTYLESQLTRFDTLLLLPSLHQDLSFSC